MLPPLHLLHKNRHVSNVSQLKRLPCVNFLLCNGYFLLRQVGPPERHVDYVGHETIHLGTFASYKVNRPVSLQ